MSREDSQALHDAYAKIQTLQMDVEALSNVSKKIVSDRGQIDDELSVRMILSIYFYLFTKIADGRTH